METFSEGSAHATAALRALPLDRFAAFGSAPCVPSRKAHKTVRCRLFNSQLQPLRACASTIAYEYVRRYAPPAPFLAAVLHHTEANLRCSQVAVAPDARPRCRARCRIAASTGHREGCIRGSVSAATTGHVLSL